VRDDGGRLHLFGNFYARAAPALVVGAVRDPNRWFRATLERALTEAGIGIDPQAPARSLPAHTHETPLRPVLRRALVHSSNFAAEQCLRVLGAELLDDGSLAGGIRAMERELGRLVGNLPDSTHLADGSGLSRDSRITPALVLEVLLVAVSRGSETVKLLASAGAEGTLSGRFVDSPVAARVRAKTGWIAGASALSGVLELRSGHQRLFSILMSYDPNRGGLNRQLKKLQERMVEAMDRLPAAGRVQPPAVSHEPGP
jgi:D-alanyl-D-alanine carboxypeptidase/D-alanyl-D-alanine-endopeptidase (penicillin-binding protein 4)